MTIRRPTAAFSVLFFVFVAGLCCHAETFRNPYRIPTTIDPASVIVGDLNGDGLPDIIWGDISVTPDVLHVLLAQRGGGYLSAPDLVLPFATGVGCRLLDANSDGKLDLVCPKGVAPQAWVALFLGNGDGTFSSPTYTQLPTTNNQYVDIGIFAPLDLNGDGILDLAVVDGYSSRTYLLLGDGHGNFNLSSTINSVAEPVAIDINGDGKPDLLFPELAVAIGNGNGTFGPISGDATSNEGCVYADVERTGHVDAVCGSGNATNTTGLSILHGNPDGSFNYNPIAAQTFGDGVPDGEGPIMVPIAVKDINGDGILDVIALDGDGYTVLLGQGNLHYSYPTHFAAGYIPFTSLVYEGNFPDVLLQFADMNGDGLPDIITTGPNGIYISYARQDGTLATAPAYEVTPVIGYSTVADFNSDGVPDIVASGYLNLEMSLGYGDGTFAPYTPIPRGTIDFSTASSSTNAHILHGDFNGDGNQDIIAIGSPGPNQDNSYLLLGHGDGTFDPPLLVANNSVLNSLYSTYSDQSVFDINHDGRDDILSRTTSSVGAPVGQINFSLSNGDGTFANVTTTVPADVVPNSRSTYISTAPALADFNGDGKLDAVYGGLSNAYMVLGHGDGTFDSTGPILPIPPLQGVPSLGAIAAVTGDFDGDGKKDFALLIQYGGSQYPDPDRNATAVFVYYGNGDGTFSSPVLAGIFDRNYGFLLAADLNLDGCADLILKTELNAGYAVGVVHGLPGRTFGPEINYTAGTGLSSLSIVDLNHDGFPDLVFANGDYNIRASSDTILLNLGNTPTVSGVLFATPEPSAFGQSFTVTAILTPPAPAALAGNVAFSIDGASIGSAPLSGNTAALSASANLAVGTHRLTAIWLGDSTDASVSLSATHTVSGLATTTTLTSSLNPANYGQPVTFTATVTNTSSTPGTPTGSITLNDGSTLLATQALTPLNGTSATAAFPTNALAVGNHVITATFAPSAGFAASSGSLTEVINPLASTTTLTAAPNPALFGQAVTLTAAITGSLAVTTGTVTFYDGPTALQTLPLGPTGQASLITTTLPVGTNTLTAIYAGNSVYATSTSLPFTEIINPLPADFTITLASPTLTLRTQHHTTTTVTLQSLNGFSDSLTLTCANLPTYLTCRPTPATTTLAANGQSTVSLYLDTDSVVGYALTNPGPRPAQSPSGIAWGLLLSPFGIFAFGRPFLRRFHHPSLFLALAMLSFSLALAGCGTIISPYDSPASVAPGTYTIPITATGATTHVIHTVQLTLTVTP